MKKHPIIMLLAGAGLLTGVAYCSITDAKTVIPHKAQQKEVHKPEHKKEPPPEAFVVMDLATEAFENSPAGIGVKIAELKPKVEHINDLYHNGHKHEAYAMVLGIATELVILGFCIETLGVGDMFVSAISLGNNWAWQGIMATAGVFVSSKIALFAGEKVEQATEEKLHHRH